MDSVDKKILRFITESKPIEGSDSPFFTAREVVGLIRKYHGLSTDQFNRIQDADAGIASKKPLGYSHGPKDLNEFLACLQIDVDSIDYARRNILAMRDNEESTTEQRGASYMMEDNFRSELYKFVKNYLHWFYKEG